MEPISAAERTTSLNDRQRQAILDVCLILLDHRQERLRRRAEKQKTNGGANNEPTDTK